MARQPVVSPQIVEAMKRDPRVALAMQAMQGAGNGGPVVGMGDGLARVLQGAMGGFMAKKAENKYSDQQQAYMDDVRKQIASVMGTGAQPGPGIPSGLPGKPEAPGLPGMGATPPVPGGPAGNPPTAALAQALAGAAGGAQPPLGGPPPLPVGNTAPPAPVDPLAPLPAAPPPMPAKGPDTVPPPGMPPGLPPGMPPNGMPPPSSPQAGPGVMQPGMPSAPGVPTAQESLRKRLGMALMGGGNAYSFNQGLEDYYAGLKEDAQNEADVRDKTFQRDNARYGAELGDYFGARGDARGAEYGRQKDERQFVYDEAKARNDFERQWKLHKDSQLFQAGESDKDRYWNMYQFIGKETGTLPDVGDIEGVDDDTLFNALILQESGGRGTAVSSQGALGSTQMLPGTAKEMADKLGVPYQPELLRSDAPEALQYQRLLGKAYFDEGMQKYGGDVQKALMYYHGGPDESQWGPKTKAYPGQVLSRLPKALEASGGHAGSIGSLIRQANASRPMPGGGTLFGVTPVNKGKPVAAGYKKKIEATASSIENMLDLSNGFNDGFVGQGFDFAGRTRNFVNEHTGTGNQDAVQWWKQYDQMNNTVRNQLFGAALTQNEQRLWDRSVIDTGTSPETARKYLDNQVRILHRAMERSARAASVSGNSAEVYELAGGDYMRDRINEYQPTARKSKAESGAAKPETITLGNNTFVKDKGGWRLTSAPKAAAPQQRKAAPVSPLMNGLVFGKQPGQVDWSKYNQPSILRR